MRERQTERLHAGRLHLFLKRLPVSLRESVDVQSSSRLLLLCQLLQLVERIEQRFVVLEFKQLVVVQFVLVF